MKYWLALNEQRVTKWCGWIMSVGFTLAIGIWLGWLAGQAGGGERSPTVSPVMTISTPSGKLSISRPDKTLITDINNP